MNRYIALRIAHYLHSIVVKETVPKLSGELAKSMRVTAKGDGAILGTNKPYAAMVHNGSNKPVVIRAKRKKALCWLGGTLIRNSKGKGVGQELAFAKKVVLYAKHPRKGKPYFKQAINILKERIHNNFDSVLPDLKPMIKQQLIEKLRSLKGISVSS